MAFALRLATVQPLRTIENLRRSDLAWFMYGCCGDGASGARIFPLPREGLMLKKRLIFALIGALIFAPVMAPPALAKSKMEKEAARIAKVKAGVAKLGVGEDARIAVKLRDKTKLAGYVSQIGEASFVITDLKTGENTEVPYPNVTQAKGKNLSTGAIIAISAGVAVGVTFLVLYLIWALSDN
ncbi:MAG: hypothetical protein ACKVX9_01295 [Blastocatellia bacterium]